MKYEIKEADMIKFLREHREEANDIGFDVTEDDFEPYYFAREQGSSFWLQYMKPVGKMWLEGDTFYFDSDGGGQEMLRAISSLTGAEYESSADSIYWNIWQAFGLGGDDYVDYFGGYIDTIADMADLWEKYHTS